MLDREGGGVGVGGKKGSGSNGIHIFFPLTLAYLCMVIYFSFIEIVIYK